MIDNAPGPWQLALEPKPPRPVRSRGGTAAGAGRAPGVKGGYLSRSGRDAPGPVSHTILQAIQFLSQESFITTGSHGIYGSMNLVIKPVTIRRGAWITARCIVLQGVEVGENAVVTPGSVVHARYRQVGSTVATRPGSSAGAQRQPGFSCYTYTVPAGGRKALY